MKPTTFLSIIGISILFLASYSNPTFNKTDNKVIETTETSSVDIAICKEKQAVISAPNPETKNTSSISHLPIEKTKELQKKEAVADEDTRVVRDPDARKDFANVFWKKEYTLFDLITDKPIFSIYENGLKVYKIYYSSNEDPNPYQGTFTEEQLERHLFYKFEDIESCIKFCNTKK